MQWSADNPRSILCNNPSASTCCNSTKSGNCFATKTVIRTFLFWEALMKKEKKKVDTALWVSPPSPPKRVKIVKKLSFWWSWWCWYFLWIWWHLHNLCNDCLVYRSDQWLFWDESPTIKSSSPGHQCQDGGITHATGPTNSSSQEVPQSASSCHIALRRGLPWIVLYT